MADSDVTFFWKSTCSTCRDARKVLRSRRTAYVERDLGKQPLDVAELQALVAGRPLAQFFNARNEEARERGWNKQPPPDQELLAAMACNPNLIRRPILVVGGDVVIGFDAARYQALL